LSADGAGVGGDGAGVGGDEAGCFAGPRFICRTDFIGDFAMLFSFVYFIMLLASQACMLYTSKEVLWQ
jgi:hypothetical protein